MAVSSHVSLYNLLDFVVHVRREFAVTHCQTFRSCGFMLKKEEKCRVERIAWIGTSQFGDFRGVHLEFKTFNQKEDDGDMMTEIDRARQEDS